MQHLRSVEDLLDSLPPIRHSINPSFLRTDSTRYQALLIPIRHSPPLPDPFVLAHLGHIPIEVVSNILETRKKHPGVFVMKYRVCTSPQLAPSSHHRRRIPTVLDIALFYLLQHLRPDLRMAFLVLLNKLRLELHNLRNAPALVLRLRARRQRLRHRARPAMQGRGRRRGVNRRKSPEAVHAAQLLRKGALERWKSLFCDSGKAAGDEAALLCAGKNAGSIVYCDLGARTRTENVVQRE